MQLYSTDTKSDAWSNFS